MSHPAAAVLVAGVGNVFLGDDGFGVEVVRRLAGEELPAGVEVADFGVRGLHLAYRLCDGCETLILVDALSRGDAPGTVFVLEAADVPARGDGSVDAHGLDPASVLALAKQLGGAPHRVLVVGCEPLELGGRMGLSEAVERAVPRAALMVRQLAAEAVRGGREWRTT